MERKNVNAPDDLSVTFAISLIESPDRLLSCTRNDLISEFPLCSAFYCVIYIRDMKIMFKMILRLAVT